MTKKIIRRKVADKTREKILKVATKLFAANGYAATTTRTIAQTAHINETLIFHHFGNKKQLWRAVKAHGVDSLQLPPLDLQPTALSAFLSAVIHQRLTAFTLKPEFARLLQWQHLEPNAEQLMSGNKLSPDNWLPPILYLQKNKKLTTAIPAKNIIIWLVVSINTLIFDKNIFFKSQAEEKEYIKNISHGFMKALQP